MEITVLDTNLAKSSVIDVFESFIWTDRYSKAGDFELVLKASIENIQALLQDYYLSIKESEHTMIIETANLKTDIEAGNNFIVTGRSLESILSRRIVWNQTVLNGNLQAGIKLLLDQNAISPLDPDRKISNLIFEESTDPLVTVLSINEQFTGDNLYDVIQYLCAANSIGFKITLSTDNKFVFKLYAGQDRSFDQLTNPFVSFSPDLDNLSNTNYYHSRIPLKTITLVGGEGEGSDRIMAQASLVTGGNTELNRREVFTDARDVSSLVNGVQLSSAEYNTLLVQRGLLVLLENLSVSSFDGKVNPNVNYIYGVDYFIGDIVQIANEYGLRGKSRVTELVFSEDLSGRDIYPTFEMIE